MTSTNSVTKRRFSIFHLRFGSYFLPSGRASSAKPMAHIAQSIGQSCKSYPVEFECMRVEFVDCSLKLCDNTVDFLTWNVLR